MSVPPQLDRLREILDRQTGRYKALNKATNLGAYLGSPRDREDEEMLTEPVLEEIIEQVLGFPRDAYFPQLGRSGLKPDFTPIDTVAHRFVFDAKSSTQDLAHHEAQIRKYIDQRHLDLGVLFNLGELRVYRRGKKGHDPELSFDVLALWRVARGEAMALEDVQQFERFCGLLAFHEMDFAAKVAHVAQARPWSQRAADGDTPEIDLEFLTGQLRRLSDVMAEDAASQQQRLLGDLDLDRGRDHMLRLELDTLSREIEPGVSDDDLPQSVAGYAAADGVGRRAWRQYLMRVSQLTLTRVLLYRSWEDAGFVETRLYDGGFELAYERLERDLGRVLAEAFAGGRERYRWLFGEDNNYDWYRPRDEALAEVLYALVPFPLAQLGADVLGGLYESYVDDIDRDRLGQFYTPREVVRFMLDRAGFAGPAVFSSEGDNRHERRIFDFATGSGGFLVEAARRVIDDGGLDLSNAADLRDGLGAIVRGFHGCEISPFPYYLTEINLLLQVSRLLGPMRETGASPASFTLGVLHTDSLSARGSGDASLNVDAALRKDAAKLSDERYGIVPLDPRKQHFFDDLREDSSFDLVVGNPPYVAESNNKILFDRLRALPQWQHDYHGKSDYLYYFLLMAAEKVAPGGRFAVITPAGWMNAGHADWLRRQLAEQLVLDELFLFGSMRVFATEREERDTRAGAKPPTVESAILIATKGKAAAGHKLRVVLLEDEEAAAQALTGKTDARVPRRADLLAEMARRASGRVGRKDGVLVHDIAQAGLRAEEPWPIKHSSRDVAARVVAQLDQALAKVQSPVEQLDVRWSLFRGIETGADSYSNRVVKRLSRQDRAELDARGARVGDPVLELAPAAAGRPPWSTNPEVLAKSPEPRGLLYGAVDEADHSLLVLLRGSDTPPPEVLNALEPWRVVLRNRAEIARNPRRKWWETAWPRDRDALDGPKVIALYRTDRGRFAVDEDGQWRPSNKSTIVTPAEPGLSVAYLCGLLNSELLDLWYAVRGKTPWHVRRNYEPKPMARMPYRHVPLPEGWSAPPGVSALRSAIETRDMPAVEQAVVALLDGGDDVARKAAVEDLVRAIAANRRALLPHRAVAPALTQAVKNPWRTHGVFVDRAAALAALPESQWVSARIDPELTVEVLGDGVLGTAHPAEGRLEYRHARKLTATISGPEPKLTLIAETLVPKGLLAADIRAARVPVDLAAFERHVQAVQDEIDGLLDAGRALVEHVERLVCRLYGIDDKLTELVIGSAVERAGQAGATD